MMSGLKLLIDTNVFIGLEDPLRVDPSFAEIMRKCAEHGIGLFIHEAALLDISRDKDVRRRDISISKLSKFQKLSSPKMPPQSDLELLFGAIKKHNDEVDVKLLYTLSINAIDLLITEDQGIHNRVKYTSLSSRVLTVQDAVVWLRRTYDPTTVMAASQCITSVGVIEAVTKTTRLDDLIRLTAKRSVFSEPELRAMMASDTNPIRVIDFLLMGHVPKLSLESLLELGVFNRKPPQSICLLSPARFNPLRERLQLGFDL